MKLKKPKKGLVPTSLKERVRREAESAKKELEKKILADHPLVDRVILQFFLEGYREGYEAGRTVTVGS